MPEPGGPIIKQIVAASGRDFQRAFGGFLTLDFGKIGQNRRCRLQCRLRAGKHLRAAKMVGHGDQAARRQNIDGFARPSCFRTAGMRADQPFAHRIGANGGRQTTGDGSNRAIQRQFADDDIGTERIARNRAKRGHEAKRNGKIIMAAFFGQIRRGQIDGDFLGGHRQAGGMKRRLNPLAAFGDGLVSQANDLHAGLARRDHHLHIDRNRLNALKCNRTHPRNHLAHPRISTEPVENPGKFTRMRRVNHSRHRSARTKMEQMQLYALNRL